jgi:phage terminase Nu1 subunit (DNA packaging protein)
MRRLYSITDLFNETGVSRSAIKDYLGDEMAITKQGASSMYTLKQFFEAYKKVNGRRFDPGAEQARLNHARADKQEMDNDKMRGEVVVLADVVDMLIPYISNCVTRLLGIPTKVAPMVIGMKRLPEITVVLEEAIYEAVGELHDIKPSSFGGPLTEVLESTTKTDINGMVGRTS